VNSAEVSFQPLRQAHSDRGLGEQLVPTLPEGTHGVVEDVEVLGDEPDVRSKKRLEELLCVVAHGDLGHEPSCSLIPAEEGSVHPYRPPSRIVVSVRRRKWRDPASGVEMNCWMIDVTV
jgi:hypothetical protein